MPARSSRRDYRTWIIDGRRWDEYRPRPDDIVIATYPKCGTTWTQRIVSLLVFQTPEPLPLMETSAWLDRRYPEPLESVMERLDAQRHRRFIKSHLPADGLPFHPDVRYINVARDGRDVCLSFHNHATAYTLENVAALDASGLADETIGRRFPEIPEDPADYFHQWLTRGEFAGEEDGSPMLSYFGFHRTWWDVRNEPNVLFLHYADLKRDLPGEMARVADFLGITVEPELWPVLVEAASFPAMKQVGAVLMGSTAAGFRGGAERFFNRGVNDRWRGVLREEDLALYQAKCDALPEDCARWLAGGRHGFLAEGADELSAVGRALA